MKMNNKTNRRAKRTNRRTNRRRTNRQRTNRRRTNYVGGMILTKRPSGMNMTITGDFETKKSTKTKGNVTIEFDSGETYVGPCDSKYNAHGTGTMTFSDGTVYVGVFIDGKKSGRGRIDYADGCVYDGEFLEDAPHGTGIYTTAEGRYEGQLVYGHKEGPGKMTFTANGDVYEGNFNKDRIEGAGTLTKIDGTVAQGNFRETKRDGIILVSEPEDPMPSMAIDPNSDLAQSAAIDALLVQLDADRTAHNQAIKREAIAESVAASREDLERKKRLHAAILAGNYKDAPLSVLQHALGKGGMRPPHPL